MGGNNKRKVNIPMCAALVLLFLTMLSIHLTSGLYARYTVSSTSHDSARVAKFDVTADVQPATDSEGKEVEGQFILTVTNNSEVSIRYDIRVSCTPMTVTVDGKSLSENAIFTDDSWMLAPNSTPVSHTLQFSIAWTGGLTDQENRSSGETEDVTFDFDVEVIATQID